MISVTQYTRVHSHVIAIDKVVLIGLPVDRSLSRTPRGWRRKFNTSFTVQFFNHITPRKSQGEKKFFSDIVNQQITFKKSGFPAVTKAIFELARDVVQQTE
jgi:hypothetical protein